MNNNDQAKEQPQQAVSDAQIMALFNDIRISESGWSDTKEQRAVVLKFARSLLRPASQEAEKPQMDAYDAIFRAIGDAVEWREHKCFGISPSKLQTSLATNGYVITQEAAREQPAKGEK